MSQASNLYQTHWYNTKKTDQDRQTLRNVCVCLAEQIEIFGDEAFVFGDKSKIIFTHDNIQVSLT